VHLGDCIKHPIDQIVGIDDEECIFHRLEVKILLNRKSLELEHFSEKFPFYSTSNIVDMQMLDASTRERLTIHRKVIIISKILLHFFGDNTELLELFPIQLSKKYFVGFWYCHEMLIVARIGKLIVEDRPVFSFPKKKLPLSMKITKRASIISPLLQKCFVILSRSKTQCHRTVLEK